MLGTIYFLHVGEDYVISLSRKMGARTSISVAEADDAWRMRRVSWVRLVGEGVKVDGLI